MITICQQNYTFYLRQSTNRPFFFSFLVQNDTKDSHFCYFHLQNYYDMICRSLCGNGISMLCSLSVLYIASFT